MANQGGIYRVVGHFTDASGNTLKHFGSAVFIVNPTEPPGNSLITTPCNPAAVNTILSSNGKIPIIPGSGTPAVFQIDGYANIAMPVVNILS
jgi:hypothetical protein